VCNRRRLPLRRNVAEEAQGIRLHAILWCYHRGHTYGGSRPY
jgi:hypothetical protein